MGATWARRKVGLGGDEGGAGFAVPVVAGVTCQADPAVFRPLVFEGLAN